LPIFAIRLISCDLKISLKTAIFEKKTIEKKTQTAGFIFSKI